MKASMLITIVTVLFMTCGCDEKTIGYLQTENTGYSADTIVFKAVLNPEDKDDAKQIRLGEPFSTGEIQGVQGTLPIIYSIRRIDCNNGANEAAKQFCLIGKGRIQLSCVHTVPIGRYTINLRIENEGHCHDVDSVLTVVVN